jgi:hypothetical protein
MSFILLDDGIWFANRWRYHRDAIALWIWAAEECITHTLAILTCIDYNALAYNARSPPPPIAITEPDTYNTHESWHSPRWRTVCGLQHGTAHDHHSRQACPTSASYPSDSMQPLNNSARATLRCLPLLHLAFGPTAHEVGPCIQIHHRYMGRSRITMPLIIYTTTAVRSPTVACARWHQQQTLMMWSPPRRTFRRPTSFFDRLV